MGVYSLLFNFYVLSLGYEEDLLGDLITIGSAAAMILALPMGFLVDKIGRKTSLILSGLLMMVSVGGMVLWPSENMFYAMNVLLGASQSLAMVTMAPFLTENSGEEERTYLFSFGMGLNMAFVSVGNWVGGYLPTWVGRWRQVDPESAAAYAGSLLAVGVIFSLGVIPLLFLRRQRLETEERSVFAPFAYAAKHPRLLGKMILPLLLTSIGAGLIIPFMNVFFRVAHGQPDPVIGKLFAWGSLAMGIGFLIAPPLAQRWGRIQFVVITQALSIPFLIALGFAPWFWLSVVGFYFRQALMNMSSPIYQTFVMERVDPDARATVASLVGIAWSFGWAFSPTLSGNLQVKYGFGPSFIGTIALYSVAVFLYWFFFWRGGEVDPSTGSGQAQDEGFS